MVCLLLNTATRNADEESRTLNVSWVYWLQSCKAYIGKVDRLCQEPRRLQRFAQVLALFRWPCIVLFASVA